jgi:hypothetical protein
VGDPAFVALRQYYPVELGQQLFVRKRDDDYLDLATFDSTNAEAFAWRFLNDGTDTRLQSAMTRDGSALYVGFNSPLNELLVVPDPDLRLVTAFFSASTAIEPRTKVLGLSMNAYNGYFDGDPTFFDSTSSIQPTKKTISIASLGNATNALIV